MSARREVMRAAACGLLAATLAACTTPGRPRGDARPPGAGGARPPDAAITARPGVGTGTLLGPGTHRLRLSGPREFLLQMPDAPGPVALAVSLHGAGGDAPGGLSLLSGSADAHGFAVLAPASRGRTWDAIGGGYGRDVTALDEALQHVFGSVDVDPGRVAVVGFSDGASYALGLGLANGDLFRRVVAFSPGFVPPAPRSGDPVVFVSHGTRDDVLPIRATSRRVVPSLQADGYDVTYREFDGGHAVPPAVVAEAVTWLGWDAPA